MTKSIFLSTIFHIIIISLTAISFPYMLKKPIDLPPIISIELIQISDITNIPYAPKAKKILEKIKKEKERVVSEQAPPKIVKKEKPDAIPLPKDAKKKKKIKTKKQNPKKIETEIKQVSEFEKKELFDPDQIAALIDKSKVETAETMRKSDILSQSQEQNSITPYPNCNHALAPAWIHRISCIPALGPDFFNFCNQKNISKKTEKEYDPLQSAKNGYPGCRL